MRQFLLALQFLTIVPVKVSGTVTGKDMSGSAAFFPLAGALQGLAAVCAALLSAVFFPPEITAGLVLVVLIVSNGGFHLDGLADTFDALSVKSGGDHAADREKKLRVMKDSTTGAIGVVAIVMTLLLKFLFLNNILSSSLSTGCYALLFLMPVFSKWGMILNMYHGTSARQEGLGKMFIENISLTSVLLASLLLAFIYFAADRLYLHATFGVRTIMLFIVLIAVFYILRILSASFFKSRFGGITGDTLGAAGEISEIIFLMVTSLWLQRFI
jgi:adenosylcobinamide-GDP ribazoletransferase